MNIKLVLGSEQADFSEAFNVTYSIGDIKNLAFGNSNKSYTLNLPLTKTNKRLLKYVNQPDVKSEPSSRGWLYLNELLILSGTVIVTQTSDYSASVMITQDDWMDTLGKIKMTSLDLSAYDYTLTKTAVSDSWSAAYPMVRYPMIDFGGLQSGEYGPTAKWYATDFIPMISVPKLITEILKPYTVSFTWLGSAYVKDLYILARETLFPQDFILKKGLDVHVENLTDNRAVGTGTPGTPPTLVVSISKDLRFGIKTLDEGGNFLTESYIVPETGTYRFKTSIIVTNTAVGNANLTITNESLTLEIKGDAVTLASVITPAYSGTEIINAITYSIDTEYVTLQAGTVVAVHLYCVVSATINSGTQSITLSTTTASNLTSIWGNANRYPGLSSTVSLEEMLPDMTQLDFLAAIRDICNLRFWMDKMKRTIYIEPWDSFVTSNVIDLTSMVDFESISNELISSNYSKSTWLQWANDSDEAYNEYLKHNIFGPGRKEVVMSSLFAKQEISYQEHRFSSLIMDYSWVINSAVQLPQIWNTVPIYPYMIFDRKVGFNTRIVHWNGLTSGQNWYYGSALQSNYPKITPLDWADLYTAYWQKLFHYIDKGKLFTIKIKINPIYLTQFFTVVNDATSEGFRPTYCITINGIANYFFLQKITTDGIMAELELVLKV